jgi:hypothetical protein
MMEWMIGQNVPSKFKKPPVSERRELLYRLEIATDDDEASDTISLTYPRTAKRHRAKAPITTAHPRKVRFIEVPNSALKQSPLDLATESAESSDGDVSSKMETDATIESEDDTKSTQQDETGVEEEPVKKKEKKKKTPDKTECRKTTTSGSEPHPTCICHECISLRREKKAAEKQRAKERKHAEESETTDQSAEATEDEAPRKKAKKNSKTKKPNKHKEESESTQESEVTEDAQTDDDSGTKREKKSMKNMQNGKGTSSRAKQAKKSIKNGIPTDNGSMERRKSKKEKKSRSEDSAVASLPKASGLRAPNLVLPIRAELFQVEHAIEAPEDPVPNAFVDTNQGVVRVYHGPRYGNPWATLYPKRGADGQPSPIGRQHPLQQPWYGGGENQGEPPAQQGHPPLPPPAPLAAQPPPGMPPPWVGGQVPMGYGPPMMWPPHGPPMPPYPGFIPPIEGPFLPVHESKPKDSAGYKDKGWDTNVGPPVGPKTASEKTKGSKKYKKGDAASHQHPPKPPALPDVWGADGVNSNNSAANVWNDKPAGGGGGDAWGASNNDGWNNSHKGNTMGSPKNGTNGGWNNNWNDNGNQQGSHNAGSQNNIAPGAWSGSKQGSQRSNNSANNWGRGHAGNQWEG